MVESFSDTAVTSSSTSGVTNADPTMLYSYIISTLSTEGVTSSTASTSGKTSVDSKMSYSDLLSIPTTEAVASLTSSTSGVTTLDQTMSYSDIISTPSTQGVTSSTATTDYLITSVPSATTLQTSGPASVSSTLAYLSQTNMESTTTVYDVCEVSELEVYDNIYLISPGKESNTEYPLNMHCTAKLTCNINKVKCRNSLMHFT